MRNTSFVDGRNLGGVGGVTDGAPMLPVLTLQLVGREALGAGKVPNGTVGLVGDYTFGRAGKAIEVVARPSLGD
jgi:hypothetical protein